DEDTDLDTTFLNVDLDVYAKSSLSPLVEALGSKVVILHVGKERLRHVAHLELARSPSNAAAGIRAFVALVERLPPPARRHWNAAQSRCFNVGVQAGLNPHCQEFSLDAATLKAATRVGATIVFTVYAPMGFDQQVSSRSNRREPG